MDHDEGDARDASQDATDPDRLLPGEYLDSRSLAEAERWAAIYTELVETKATILGALEQAMASAQQVVRDELENDRRVMLTELERLRGRQRHWRGRLGDLRPHER